MTDKTNMEEKLEEIADQAQEAAKMLGIADMTLVATGTEPLSIVIAHLASVSSLVAAMASAKEQDFESAEKLVDDLVGKFLKDKLRKDIEIGKQAREEFAGLVASAAIEKARKAA